MFERASEAATYGGGGTAVVSGAVMGVQKVLGLTPAEWAVVGVIGGLVIGVAGLAINALFQYLNYRRGLNETR
jgi:hypothetical protein